MAPEHFERIREIFHAALRQDSEKRSAFLDEACQGEPSLRAEVERLLDTDVAEDDFLETPATTGLPPGYSGLLHVGARIGQYLLVRLISSGGMGVVYEALQEHPKRTVAVKVIKQGMVSKSALRRFEYEGQILASLRHPGIAQVIEAGTHGEGGEDAISMPYLVMEYIPDAKTITEYTREKNLSTKDRLKLYLQVCEAVHHGHQKGIIHRDLKPGNILVDAQGCVKVIDFGVARVTDSDIALTTVHTEVGQLIGTLQYMSPEQCEADPHNLDIRSDVYALGVVLYELLCEELPYDVRKTAVFEAARLIREEPPRRPSTDHRALRGDVETILLKTLEKDREHRYATAADLGADLQRFLNGEVIHAKPASLATRIRKGIKRNPRLSVATGAAALTVLIFLGYVLFWSYPRIKAEKEKVSAAYDQIIRLVDGKRLSALVAKAEKLWPAFPENISKFKGWIDRAEELLGRLDLHRETLGRLRETALPYGEELKQRDGESHPKWGELFKRRKSRERLLGRIEAFQRKSTGREPEETNREEGREAVGGVEAMEKQLEVLEKQISTLEKEIFKNRKRHFNDVETQWRHDTLADLVSRIESFSNPEKGLLKDVKDRLAFARTIERRSIGEHREEWDQAVRSIADPDECPQYNGLRLKEKLCFVPIGRDPESGLWEFAHLQTGGIPEREKDGKLVLTEETGLVFVLIPGGSFMMGAERPSKNKPLGSPNVDPGAQRDEKPVHEVSIEPFFISKYEMTQGQWLRVVGKNPSFYVPGRNFGGKKVNLIHPVENVSWEDCWGLLFRLNLRFPSEAEWEYAARAGTRTIWWTGNDKESLAGAVNLCDIFCHEQGGPPSWAYEKWLDDGYTAHAPVGGYLPNAFGLHDVCGNVWEWCQDSYIKSYEGAFGDGTAFESLDASTRIMRGGSWETLTGGCSSAGRAGAVQDSRIYHTGVRPAASVQE